MLIVYLELSVRSGVIIRPTPAWPNRATRGHPDPEKAELGIKFHPHMLRRLRLQAGQRWDGYAFPPGNLGHKNIQHTVRYTELSPTRFKDFWRRNARILGPVENQGTRERAHGLAASMTWLCRGPNKFNQLPAKDG
jgi:hypothetical protein